MNMLHARVLISSQRRIIVSLHEVDAEQVDVFLAVP
jgi:hypothetical protein